MNMTKIELLQILNKIADYYESFSFNKRKIESWHDVLKDADEKRVEKNLHNYVKNYSDPPKIADLLRQEKSRDIPDARETKDSIKTVGIPSTLDVVQQELANLRNILGIHR
ncbi:replicative helicase loader/inhibitor [Bacillus sp. MUM 13]|uniref:replicative helicase loader/inhibitor n=1 Tax=Bacillus sp. MUM 13 TaxID=1678001 RepID=UPI0009F58B32|nr:replicative helicase loader/inhibitor [Bacillus sp. MUM 13]